MNWRRGFFRAWLVFAVAWIALTGWNVCGSKPWNQNWVRCPQTEGECWDRVAKWPDGQRFTVWDIGEEADVESNVEINKKKKAWSAEDIPARNRWTRETTQKLLDCEAATTPTTE